MKLAILLTMLVIIFIFIIYVIWLEVQKALTEQDMNCYCITHCLDEEILQSVQDDLDILKKAWQL